tara:strand:- start:412 stop:924 length:513 start_codon:yes stop_codon:yes gene_type:complete
MISNYGNVLSFTKDKVNGIIMNPYRRLVDKSNSYLKVRFYDKNTKNIKHSVHTLVMHYFYGPRPIGLDIDHINRIKTDNRISNLRYCTVSENQRNTKRYRSDIKEQDIKKRTRIRNNETQSKIYKQQLCFCGYQRRFRFNHNTNSKTYTRFLNHLKTIKHKNYMKNFLKV